MGTTVGVTFIAIKRENMIKNDEEAEYHRTLSKLRKKIEILSVVDNFGFIRAISRRGLVVKIILGLLAFNIYQLLGLGSSLSHLFNNFRATLFSLKLD